MLEKQLHFGHLQIHNQERRSLSCPHTTELVTADCFFPKHNNLPDVVRWFINNKVFWAMFYSWKLPVSMSSSRGLQIEDHGMTSGNRDRHREIKLARICQFVFLIIWKQQLFFFSFTKKGFLTFLFMVIVCGSRQYSHGVATHTCNTSAWGMKQEESRFQNSLRYT